MSESKYIDMESALTRVGGNKGLYEKLLAKFDGSFDMQAFDSAIESGDYQSAGDIAHSAKGVAGNLSLTAFFDQSVIVMDQLREGNYDKDSVDKFRQLYSETKTAINELLGN